ncbi:unnamed protein product [Microthlaspi erraticum]|uniref:KIB1-4 beta-propeller domain-containing protein n=1 Tax=Microthlaspi erraticum TaxID=1685480 RepID=A0A6D2II01_9BRAS|nr:unnamed protein product [Microthlaspi erraticum]CAA7027220.1 unnamed protein product [Microthlaspi erraticum]
MFRQMIFRDLPELQPSEYQLLASGSREEHWVQSSSSGESFFVQWYSYVSPPQLGKKREPVFMVYREEETTENSYMCYTEDIGDLCIFLSESHPFCVEASSCPGLEPNSIYLISHEDFAVYSLATKTCRGLKPPKIGPAGGEIQTPFLPYWIPPLSV